MFLFGLAVRLLPRRGLVKIKGLRPLALPLTPFVCVCVRVHVRGCVGKEQFGRLHADTVRSATIVQRSGDARMIFIAFCYVYVSALVML